ncbi:DUF2750 domain-containing protein [Alteromonas facilis]|uniref:DUF2750 domain-containing protein n=1 Tax=Alteromonas facilis TaxID=2048004 RepID=UPI000C282C6F|nr:DUF2750 domain-containing protein [Alteromonas facilis]
MNDRNHSPDLNDMLAAPADKRVQIFDQLVNENQLIWILSDDDGAVMLTTDDDDCIPVWPTQESAELWRNEEWSDCSATPISLKDWFARWTMGMQQDDLCVAVFPVPGEDGMVLLPEELETLLKH